MSTTQIGKGLIAARFFLGIVQSAMFPGIVYYISLWYSRNEQGARMAGFLVMGAIGSVRAYGIIYMDGIRGLRAWRWIFIIISLPTFLVACVIFSFLPDTPERQKHFLNPWEQEVAIYRLGKDIGPGTKESFTWKQFRSAFKDWKVYVYAATQITCMVPIVSLGVFMPSIVRGMGFSNLQDKYIYIYIYIYIRKVQHQSNFAIAQAINERGIYIVVACFIAVIGYMLLIILADKGILGLYASAIIATSAVTASNPPRVAWTNNFDDQTKRGIVIAFTSSCASIGSVIGGQIYRADDAPHYTRGHAITLAFIAVNGILSLILKFLLRHKNIKRDRMSAEHYQKESHKIGDEVWFTSPLKLF
ncbi:major facilitator superfamily domain-containing protein [Fennellomyces sp. T-0311]|nr:major facilitator superfamily domain-containing protein [Fennellomyces sp. T-0311]